MEKIANIDNSINNLSDFTLIIPSVSVGNVGQLTVDLLISCYDFEKIATIWDPAIVPVVGSDAFDSKSSNLSTACELFINKNLKIATIQLRSTIEYQLAAKFFEKLKNLVLECKFKEVLIVTSSFAYEMHDVSSSKFRYVTNHKQLEDQLKNANFLPLEQADGIHGGGYATRLYNVLSPCIRCTILMKYSSEGDNRPDAIYFLQIISSIISINKLEADSIKYPVSWKHVFGNPPPLGMY